MAAILGIGLYTALVGASYSVLRAAVMGGLALLQGYTVLRTDRNGWIELTTDGMQMWVEAAR